MKILSILLLISFFYAGEVLSQTTSNNITTFILVRHAEKVDDSHNPELSSDGYERTAQLTRMLQEIQFDAVYSTPLIRTTETARKIAEENDIEISEYDHRNLDSLAEKWIKMYNGNYILIAGHSNSTPMLANALLGREHFKEKFDESDYGNILIVTISDENKRNLLHLRY